MDQSGLLRSQKSGGRVPDETRFEKRFPSRVSSRGFLEVKRGNFRGDQVKGGRSACFDGVEGDG